MRKIDENLIQACIEGKTEIIKVLIDSGADVDARDEEGHTGLMRACQCGHSEVADVLVHHGADVNLVGPEGCTALSLAIEKGDQDTIALLKAKQKTTSCRCGDNKS